MDAHAAHRVVIGLGSNVGDRAEALRRARDALAPYVMVEASSRVYEMPASQASDQPLFLNAAVRGVTALDPMGLLYTVKDIEIALGRLPTFHFGPRVIDIDILFYDDVVLHTTELTIPHPSLQERAFVLRPLMDLCPSRRHPALGQTVEALWDALPKDEPIVDVGGLDENGA